MKLIETHCHGKDCEIYKLIKYTLDKYVLK